MYDRWEEAAEAIIKYHADFQPDSIAMSFMMSGASMECLGQTNMKWAGFGLPDDVQYQYVEQEFMKDNEYSLFLADPSDFMMRRLMPRMYSSLKGLQKMPWFGRDAVNIGGLAILPFMDPEVIEALGIMKNAAEMKLRYAKLAKGIAALKRARGEAQRDAGGAPAQRVAWTVDTAADRDAFVSPRADQRHAQRRAGGQLPSIGQPRFTSGAVTFDVLLALRVELTCCTCARAVRGLAHRRLALAAKARRTALK